MLILGIKLLLVPALLALVTVAGRRWGAVVAGWLGSFPIVAGPILLILAIEFGPQFGARAAQRSLAGIAAAMVFYVTYARLAGRAGWLASLVGALAAWAASLAVLQLMPQTLPAAAAVALAALAIAPRLLGTPLPLRAVAPLHPLELPTRMAAGAGLTVFTAWIGARLGPDASGYAALFPVVGLVVSVFSHASQGAGSAQQFLRGMTRGMWSVATVCCTLILLLPRSGIATAFAAAVAVGVATHALMRPRQQAA